MIGKIRKTRALQGALCALFVAGATAGAAFAAESGPALDGVVNVNTASVEQLQILPGVGERRAEQIVEMRKERGGFKSVDELTDVKGIGDSMLERLRDHVTLDGKTTAARR
jgi:competence protein ComEA